MSGQSRRSFMKAATAAAASGMFANFAIAGTKTTGNILGANDTVRVAVAGIHGRGGSHISAYAGMKNVQVAYLVDPDKRTWDSKVKAIERKAGNTPKCFQDVRQMLECKDVDAVSIATCNHWHSLITIWSCQAGKDVYVEKPCSHNVFEGRKCVEAARRYERMVQHGTQSRANAGIAVIADAIKSGKYGKLLVAKGYCCKPRWSIGYKPVGEPPKELDYNLWLGPAPMQPYHENLVHYNWHWFWDTGNGDMGNQGVHEMDVCRWCIPNATLPKSVITMGGRWVNGPDFKDQGQTPNMELSVYDFDGTLLVFETRGLVAKKNAQGKDAFPFKVGYDFFLEAGKIIGGKFCPKGSDKPEPVTTNLKLKRVEHFANFIDCVRSRKRENLNADILDGHLSSALCHLGNISYRLGHKVSFAEARKAMGDNPQVQESVKMVEDNLKGALDIDVAKITCCQGPKLPFDAKAEKFVNNAAADELLTRKYRAPFVVPEKV